MTTLLPTIMISGRRGFWIGRGAVMTMTMAILVAVAVVACDSVERKGDDPDPDCGAHFKCSR